MRSTSSCGSAADGGASHSRRTRVTNSTGSLANCATFLKVAPSIRGAPHRIARQLLSLSSKESSNVPAIGVCQRGRSYEIHVFFPADSARDLGRTPGVAPDREPSRTLAADDRGGGRTRAGGGRRGLRRGVLPRAPPAQRRH